MTDKIYPKITQELIFVAGAVVCSECKSLSKLLGFYPVGKNIIYCSNPKCKAKLTYDVKKRIVSFLNG